MVTYIFIFFNFMVQNCIFVFLIPQKLICELLNFDSCTAMSDMADFFYICSMLTSDITRYRYYLYILLNKTLIPEINQNISGINVVFQMFFFWYKHQKLFLVKTPEIDVKFLRPRHRNNTRNYFCCFNVEILRLTHRNFYQKFLVSFLVSTPENN